MARYELEIGPLLEAEGGSKYTNHPMDRGGPTKWGVTIQRLRLWRRDNNLTSGDVKALEKDEAIKIYKADYWDANNCDKIEYQIVAKCLFNIGVNMGPKTGAKLLQKACNIQGGSLKVDGDIGSKTLSEIKEHNPFILANELVCLMQDRYVGIVKGRPSQVVFLAGWLNRSQELMRAIVNDAMV